MAGSIGSYGNEVFGEYKFSDSFTDSSTSADKRRRLNKGPLLEEVTYFRQPYSIEYNEVVKHISVAEKSLSQAKNKIENNLLRKINVDPFLTPELEEAHFRIWDELKKLYKANSNNTLDGLNAPGYISFDELLFSERINSRAGQVLMSEYLSAISHTTFSYLFDLRRLLNLIYNELICIKNSLYTDIGGGYDTESQQKIAAQYYSWSKMATHYAERVSNTVITKAIEIPLSELDKISEKQSAQLQTIFAIKLNAVDSEVNNLLSSLKRDMVDNCDIFYTQFISPAIKFSKNIVSGLELDFTTTNMRDEVPFLAGEVYSANTVLQGNFLSVLADMVERIKLFRDNADNLMMYVREKRKYSNFISQLSPKASPKKPVLITIDEDLYSRDFRFAVINNSQKNNFESSHSSLDGLLDDDHPQYLLKSGGEISGDVTFSPNAKIGGMSLATHAHNGQDGSVRIKASDIDYSTDRSSGAEIVQKPLVVSVNQFIPEITNEGIHVCDVVINIEYDDKSLSNHDFEITFAEVP